MLSIGTMTTSTYPNTMNTKQVSSSEKIFVNSPMSYQQNISITYLNQRKNLKSYKHQAKIYKPFLSPIGYNYHADISTYRISLVQPSFSVMKN